MCNYSLTLQMTHIKDCYKCVFHYVLKSLANMLTLYRPISTSWPTKQADEIITLTCLNCVRNMNITCHRIIDDEKSDGEQSQYGSSHKPSPCLFLHKGHKFCCIWKLICMWCLLFVWNFWTAKMYFSYFWISPPTIFAACAVVLLLFMAYLVYGLTKSHALWVLISATHMFTNKLASYRYSNNTSLKFNDISDSNHNTNIT